jgi:hypothetical protein
MTMRKLYAIYDVHLERRSQEQEQEQTTPQGERMVKADEVPWL